MATGGRARGSKKPVSLRSFGVSYSMSGVGLIGAFGYAIDSKYTHDAILGVFRKLVASWSKRYMKPDDIEKAIRSATFARSGTVSRGGWKMTGGPISGGEANARRWIYTAEAGEPAASIGSVLEAGRQSGGAPKGKYYLVPLVSWMKKKSRRFTTAKTISEDLGQTEGTITKGPNKGKPRPRSFMLNKEIQTASGPARLILLLNKGARRLKRDTKGRFATKSKKVDVLGRKQTKGKLADITTRMYLAYRSTRGIWGQGSEPRKKPRGESSTIAPLAAKVGLTITTEAPRWFTRFAIRRLAILAGLIREINPKIVMRELEVSTAFYKEDLAYSAQHAIRGGISSTTAATDEGEQEVSVVDTVPDHRELQAEKIIEEEYQARCAEIHKLLSKKKISPEQALTMLKEIRGE